MAKFPKFLTAAFLAPVLLLGCNSSQPEPKPKEFVTLSKGTEIELMLLTPLDSGGTPEGAKIPFVVSRDIQNSEGKTVIRCGTPVWGEITQSRAAGAISAVINQPARLRMKLGEISVDDGDKVQLSGEKDAPQAAEFGFTKDSVVDPNEKNVPDSLFADEASREALSAISAAIDGTESFKEFEEKITDEEKLKEILANLGLNHTDEFVESQKSAKAGFERIGSALESLRKGNLSSLYGSESTLALAAIEELGSLASHVNDRIKGIFKGRNIRPVIGSKITVFVHSDAKLAAIPSAKP